MATATATATATRPKWEAGLRAWEGGRGSRQERSALARAQRLELDCGRESGDESAFEERDDLPCPKRVTPAHLIPLGVEIGPPLCPRCTLPLQEFTEA